MTIIRAPRGEKYTVLRRAIINDGRLSFRALGLLTYILDKPDNWRIEAQQLSDSHREGRDAVRTALTELEAAGYLTRRKFKNDKGQFATDSVVSEIPTKPALVSRSGEPGPITNTVTEDCVGVASQRAVARNPIYDALVEACGLNYDEMTKTERKRTGIASREIEATGATVEEVHRRAAIYRDKYAGAALTPSALKSQWGACAQGKPSAADAAAQLKGMIADAKRRR